jgi:KDO2-lipid IV(A) lauroyltransferase
VRKNLSFAFPEDEAMRARIFKEAYRHLASLSMEVTLLFGPMRRFVQSSSELRGAEHWHAAKKEGRGILFLSSHVGNWEVMAATGAIHGGFDLMLITKRLKPAWLHEAIERGRTLCGVAATYEPKTFRDVLRQLKQNGTVGLVLDQFVGPPVGVRVPVFGIPVGTSMVAATLVRRTGAVILPVVNYRLPDGRYRVEIQAPLTWVERPDLNVELAENTALYARHIEGDISAHPGQWLWTHRRFKGNLEPLKPNEWLEGRK